MKDDDDVAVNREMLDSLAERVVGVCKAKGWSLHWTHRGVYLHLESSELVEALRGKGDTNVLFEAGDVLFVLMSIIASRGIAFTDVVKRLENVVTEVEGALLTNHPDH